MNDRTQVKKILDVIDRRIKRERALGAGYANQAMKNTSDAIQDELIYLRKEIGEEFKID